jgi:hypothetical protein
MYLKKLTRSVSLGVLLLLAIPPLTLHARAAQSVVGTYSAADNGQGCWGGGPLLADGSFSGGASCSFGNGADVGRLVPSSWTTDGQSVTLTWTVDIHKGSCADFGGAGVPCLLSLPLPIGSATKVVFPGATGTTVVRVSLFL